MWVNSFAHDVLDQFHQLSRAEIDMRERRTIEVLSTGPTLYAANLLPGREDSAIDRHQTTNEMYNHILPELNPVSMDKNDGKISLTPHGPRLIPMSLHECIDIRILSRTTLFPRPDIG